MKFSENWLRTFVASPLTSRELADALTMGGIEVETIERAAPAFNQVVVAEVVDVQKHPDADRLTVCRVNAGGAPLQVVCGAPNVRAGMRAPLAHVGAQLPGLTIKQAKVRGVESNGMLCSAKELGITDEAAGLFELAADAPVGTDIRRYLDLDDQLFTIKPTPSGGDCRRDGEARHRRSGAEIGGSNRHHALGTGRVSALLRSHSTWGECTSGDAALDVAAPGAQWFAQHQRDR
jgi:phenylalanyl-tRNA synthetase beta chain